VGGPGLPAGYHRRPALTAERFVPDPFHPGARLYRTGDLARWDEDGHIFYLGRKDGQVKVNGYRVEPAEVTAALEAVEGVARAAVIHRPGTGPEAGLIAFLVGRQGHVPDETGLRAALSQRLPGHMLPVRCHVVPAIPLNHNGKVDKPALIAADDARLEERRARALAGQAPLPEGSTEQRLARLWSDILAIDTIHADDGFFALGGNSLQLLRLMDLLATHWDVRLDAGTIYVHPSLRAMARCIDERLATGREEGPADGSVAPVKAWDAGTGRHLYAMVGGAGSVEEFTKYHRIGSVLGEGWRVHILPDPDAVRGRFPRKGPGGLADIYAEILRPVAAREKVWLLGDCIGGVDAFALACRLQADGVAEVGLILMDAAAPARTERRTAPLPPAIGMYESLPERAGPLSEVLHRLWLRLAQWPTGHRLFHARPASRRQAYRMAVAFGLFDAADYRARMPAADTDPEAAFRHYLAEGWTSGEPPSPAFNAFRYAKVMDAFRPGTDEPVLHALLHGMRTRYVRRKVREKVAHPNLRSDIMAARTQLRRDDFQAGTFRGDLHLLLSERIHDRGSDLGWGRHVHGTVHRHRVTGDHRTYLKDHLAETALTLGRILDSPGDEAGQAVSR
jgi:surfactin synthase thioesterase subunit